MAGGPSDLLELTSELVEIASLSREEDRLASHLDAELRRVDGLSVERVGDNVVARTDLGRSQRLVLAGHTDTVPPDGNAKPRIAGDTLWGVGAADMKSGLAVMVDLARSVTSPAVDVTYVFYAREEIAAAESGLAELFDQAPQLLEGDAAILGEPTAGTLEAGCQGVLRLEITMAGARAHAARPWMGRNAIHRLGALLERVAGAPERRPVIDQCEYREALQAVDVRGGVAGNVVPDAATVVLSHRYAPDRSPAEAEAAIRELLAPTLDEDDRVEIIDRAPAAAPALTHPLLASLIEDNGLEVRAKLGWTDVARFSAHGIPAANFGPGEPTLAHHADERVDRAAIDAVRAALGALLTSQPAADGPRSGG